MIKIVSLLLILGANAWAVDSFTKVDPKCSMAVDGSGAHDPFDPSLVIARGPNEGKCAITAESRSAVSLSPEQLALYQISVPQGSIAFANFSDQHKHYIAVIDPSAIEDAIYQIEYFPAVVPAAHNEIRFKMKRGSEALLYSQEVDAQGHPMRVGLVKRVRNFVFSVEAVTPSDDPYDVIKGVEGHYGQSYRFDSAADKYESMVTVQHHQVRQISMNLTAGQRAELLKNALALANEYVLTGEYNTLTNSCTTEAFKAIDQTVRHSLLQEVEIKTAAGWLGETYPNTAEMGLKMRGLIKPNGASELPEMDKDQELIEDLKQGS